jgi:NAD(P)-dependent dehydrogenase (short-subunit alcohol dehydrogenase family)
MIRSALVTGSSSGIGLAIAQALIAEGYHVTIAARDAARVRAVVEGLGEYAYAQVADVSKESDVHAMCQAHKTRFGRLDILVNNAGVSQPASWDNIDTASAEREIGVNLRGPLIVTRAALPMLQAAGAQHGKALVVNISSVAGKRGQPRQPVYSATKAALISLTQSLQREYAQDGIQATAICPGLVATPAKASSGLLQSDLLDPDDVAEVVRFLLRTSSACIVPEVVLNRRAAVQHSR